MQTSGGLREQTLSIGLEMQGHSPNPGPRQGAPHAAAVLEMRSEGSLWNLHHSRGTQDSTHWCSPETPFLTVQVPLILCGPLRHRASSQAITLQSLSPPPQSPFWVPESLSVGPHPVMSPWEIFSWQTADRTSPKLMEDHHSSRLFLGVPSKQRMFPEYPCGSPPGHQPPPPTPRSQICTAQDTCSLCPQLSCLWSVRHYTPWSTQDISVNPYKNPKTRCYHHHFT